MEMDFTKVLTMNPIIVNDTNKLTLTMCHCEQSEAISKDCYACVP